MSKSAAQRLATFASQYSDFTPNPLVTMREIRGWTQPEMAMWLGVNKNVVNSAEDGMFSLIPTCYRVHILNIMTTNQEYQAFRTEKRKILWDINDFPDSPAPKAPMIHLLKHFDLTVFKFGAKACVQSTEIHKMCTKKRTMTSNFREFLDTVGLPNDWIGQFDRALSYNSEPTLRLPNP